MNGKKKRALIVAVSLAASLVAGSAIAQQTLALGGSSANFGSHRLRAGFTPDPFEQTVVSGGSIDAARLGLGAGCVGHVTREPDMILHWSGQGDFLRFFVRSGGDTTLLVNDARGGWHCNDDTDGTNPMVDIRNPPPGQYDVWVGSYRPSANLNGRLYVTELSSQRPGR